jgi:hypothetical protein
MHLKKLNGSIMDSLFVLVGIAMGFIVFVLIIDKMG